MKNNEKIYIVSGGTGGHVIPALALTKFLKKNREVDLFIDSRGIKFLNSEKNLDFKLINSGRIFNKNILKSILGFIKIIISFFYSVTIILKNRPKLVIGMGGYASFPMCFTAFIMRVPVFIYENNLIIGRANKFLLNFVDKILIANEEIKGIKKKYENKIFHCGYIIRDEILNKEINENLYQSDKNNFSILIIGGSQSAKIFGELLPDILIKCHEEGLKIKVYQQCLDYQVNDINKIYAKNKLDFELFVFSQDIIKYYKKSDLVISRAGASSLAEIINLRIPSIAIPLPSSIDNHQYENAKYYEKKGYCFLLDQNLISNKLFEIIFDLKNDRKKMHLMKEKMSKHCDKNTLLKINNIIRKFFNE